MKKKIKDQSFMMTKNRNQFNPVRNISKKFLPLCAILFVLIFSSFNNVNVPKTASPNSKNEVKNETRKMKKEIRQERRMIKSVEDIPTQTMSLFGQEFPKAQNVRWTFDAGFYEADFTSGNLKRMAFYDYDNNLVGTGKYVTYNNLPKGSLEQMDKYLKDYGIEKIIYYDDNELNASNVNPLDMDGSVLDRDDYYALMKERRSGKEIILQITAEGEVSLFRELE
ncbi:MAG: hypothetical protein ABI172_00155 [Ginsengibacter sp.]